MRFERIDLNLIVLERDERLFELDLLAGEKAPIFRWWNSRVLPSTPVAWPRGRRSVGRWRSRPRPRRPRCWRLKDWHSGRRRCWPDESVVSGHRGRLVVRSQRWQDDQTYDVLLRSGDMNATEIMMPTPSGPMRCFVVHPEADIACPVVILYMDFWGYREELRTIARRIASVGYYCVVPDLYHREDASVLNQFFDAGGRTLSVFNLDKAQLAIAAAPLRRLTDAMVLDDTQAILAHVDQDSHALATKVGAIGYCMGGRHAIEAAARWPDRFVATASLHGSYLISDRPESPHRTLDRLKGELYCGYAEHDLTAEGDMIPRFEALLGQCAVRYGSTVHAGAHHGYALPSRDVYDQGAAERDWELILAMFCRTMPPYGGAAPR